MNLLDVGENYLKAWDAKDLKGIAGYLHPEVSFKGPMMTAKGKEKVVLIFEKTLPMLKSLKIKTKFVGDQQTIFSYDFNCIDPIGLCRCAELMTYEDDKIIGIELFFDARPFEKYFHTQSAKT
jgi:hypothetical protein